MTLSTSKLTVALADVNRKFTSQSVMATPSDPEAAVKSIIQRIQAIVRTCEKKKIEGIGITLPGRFQQDTNRLIFAPNLNWRVVNLPHSFPTPTRLPVTFATAPTSTLLP